MNPVVLCQDRELVLLLESQDQLAHQLAQQGRAAHHGVQVLLRDSTTYQRDRVVYDCLAFRSEDKQQ